MTATGPGSGAHATDADANQTASWNVGDDTVDALRPAGSGSRPEDVPDNGNATRGTRDDTDGARGTRDDTDGARGRRDDGGKPDPGRHGDDPIRGTADEPPAQPTELPKAGWVEILKRSVKQFKHDDVTDRAAALTYFGVLALFPAMLVIVSILGLLGHSTTQSLLTNLGSIAPGGVKSFLTTVLNQVQGKAGTAGIAGIIGLLVALYSASGYVGAFGRASNAIYEVDEGRPAYKTIPVRIVTTLVLVVLLVLSLAIVVLTGPIATQVGKAIGIGSAATLVWDIAKWPFLLIVVSLIFSILYKATPNVKQPKFQWITPGGLIAVVVWVVASALFGVYVAFSGSYNKTYGSLATVIIFLVWLWITNIAILLGAEFNAETQRERLIQAGMPEDVEPFAEVKDTKKLDDEEKERVEQAAQVRERTVHGD